MNRRLSVLLIEDNPGDERLVREHLRGERGFELLSERTLAEGLKRLSVTDIDVVLLDPGLPDSHGVEGIAAIQQTYPLVPIIVLTSLNDFSAAVSSIKEGAQDYLVKNEITPQAIIRTVRYSVERIATEWRLDLQRRIAEVLNDSESFEAAVPRLLQATCTALGWHWAVCWDLDKDRGGLKMMASWASPDINMEPYLLETREKAQGLDDGLPGRVWKSQKVAWIPNASADPELIRTAPITRKVLDAGIRMAVAIPVVYAGNTMAVMIFGRRKPGERDERLIQVLALLGNHIGQFVERKQGEERLRQSEAQLQQSQKMEAIGLLAGGMAHDFNNILTVISGCDEMLLAEMDPDSQYFEKLDTIRKAVQQATLLTHQLLTVSRQNTIQLKLFNLNETIREYHVLLSQLLRQGISLNVELDKHLGMVMADPGQILQVIMNLVINARDAMQTNGQVTIRTSNQEIDRAYAEIHPPIFPGPHVCISISDTGCGMDSGTIKKIFEPFFTTKGIGKGTGLGLSMVYGIIRQNNGYIWVTSEPGKGSTFEIFLPLKQLGQDPGRDLGKNTRNSKGSETVLLVEDRKELRELASEVLISGGYQVIKASDGLSAIRTSALHSEPIDLLLTDMMMPGMDGRKLAELLLQNRPHIKVLFMSGFTGKEVQKEMLDGHAEAFIQKPFKPSELLKRVRASLDKPESVTAIH